MNGTRGRPVAGTTREWLPSRDDLDAATARTAAVMADLSASPADRQLAAELEGAVHHAYLLRPGAGAELQAEAEAESEAQGDVPHGPGLFEVTAPDGQMITNVRRLAGRERPAGSALIGWAAWLLGLIGAAALYVSYSAQRQYILAARHHDQAASAVEALLLDLLMIVFTLLALGLSRAGRSSRTERALIAACAAASAWMNISAADVTSPRSVTAYAVAPLALAVVVDRVVAVIRRHVLAGDEPGAWTALGKGLRSSARLAGLVLLYGLRFVMAPPSTSSGVRRLILQAAPLPPVQARTEDPYVRAYARTGAAWPAPAADRDAVIARLTDEIRDAIDSGERWQPDYKALMQATGRRRSWCEKAVREARTAVLDLPGRDTGDRKPS